MFSFIKQVFIVLLSFSKSLAAKCLFLNGEPCMVKPTVVNMSPVELKYYPFIISLNKCAKCFNVLYPNVCVPKETKEKNVKAFIIW